MNNRKEVKDVKHLKKMCMALMLSCCLMMGATVSTEAQAKEIENMQVYAIYINSYSVELSISDSGEADIEASVRGKSGVCSTSITVTLQKQTANGWEEVESWEKSNDSAYTKISETYRVSSKGAYRLVATVKANTESKDMQSQEVIY